VFHPFFNKTGDLMIQLCRSRYCEQLLRVIAAINQDLIRNAEISDVRLLRRGQRFSV